MIMPLPRFVSTLRELNPAPRSSRIHVSNPEPDMNLAKEHYRKKLVLQESISV